MFAVTNILLPLSRRTSSFLNAQETDLLIESIHKSIEILEAMDESVVATESVEIVKNHLREYCNQSGQKPHDMPNNNNHNSSNNNDNNNNNDTVATGALQQGMVNDATMPDLGEQPFDDFIPVRLPLPPTYLP